MAGIMQAIFGSYSTVVPTVGPTPGSIYFLTTDSRITLSPGIVVGGTYQSPFTVEGWIYCGDNPGENSGPVILSTTTGSGTSAYLRALTINVTNSNGTQITVDSNGATATTFNLAQSLITDAWYYVAVSRDTSGFIQLWVGKQGDASAVASTSGRFDCSVNTAAWALDGISDCIGAFVPAGRSSANDNVSGVRVTNTNLYTTTDATIPMPTETFDYVDGIQFLQSPTDLSDLTGNQTLTSDSSAAYSVAGPDISIQVYTGFVNPSITVGSAVTIVAQSPFGSGNSYSFISSANSYIDTPASADWAVGTGDFTIEWFGYQTTTAGFQRVFTVDDYSSIDLGVSIESGTFYYWNNSGVRYSSGSGVAIDTWAHWAIVRSSGTTRIYRDGSLFGVIGDSNNINNIIDELTIGNENTATTIAAYVGYITNLRWVKGLAVYTGNFTVPTSALTATAEANPYSGSNTQAIGPGYTKLLLIP